MEDDDKCDETDKEFIIEFETEEYSRFFEISFYSDCDNEKFYKYGLILDDNFKRKFNWAWTTYSEEHFR